MKASVATETLHVDIQRMPGQNDMKLPCYMTTSAAGMDIHAAVENDVVLLPGQRCLIPTGIAVSLPEGFEAQIRPRSGLAFNHGVTLLNAPGTIDADYRGEIKVILINHGQNPFTVSRGDRIAQMIVQRTVRVIWDVRDHLDRTERGQGGFGHTNL